MLPPCLPTVFTVLWGFLLLVELTFSIFACLYTLDMQEMDFEILKNLFALYFYHSFILFYTMPFLKSYVVHENAIGGKSYKEIDISFKCQVYEMIDNTK